MKTYQGRKKPIVLQLAQAGLAWVLLGIAAAGVITSSPEKGVWPTNQWARPDPKTIEHAVVTAEAQAHDAQTRTTSSVDYLASR